MSRLKSWKPSMKVSESSRDLRGLKFPNQFDARCYALVRFDGLTQDAAASVLNIAQSMVSRRVRLVAAQMAAIVDSGKFDAEEVEQLVRRLAEPARRRAS